jgi:hypothetical protein
MLMGAKWPTNPIGVFKNAATREEETKEIIRTEEVERKFKLPLWLTCPTFGKIMAMNHAHSKDI